MDFICNDVLKMDLPEGFHVMDAEERSQMNSMGDGPFECLTDPDRHITIAIGWKAAGGLAGMLLNAKDMARNMETQIRRPMKAFGYRPEGFTERVTAGLRTYGFRYTYTAQEIPMLGESLVFKVDKCFYYLHLYTRDGLREASLPVWESILDSMTFDRA